MCDFVVPREGGFLADYLAYSKGGEVYSPALQDENNNLAKTYLIMDDVTDEIAGYFSLKAGFVATNYGSFIRKNEFDSIPGIELSNFAVNETYKQNHKEYEGIGYVIFEDFIIPKIVEAQKIVGVKILYLFALPRTKLIERYKEYGFTQLSTYQQRKMHRHIRPRYDAGCIFMYQVI